MMKPFNFFLAALPLFFLASCTTQTQNPEVTTQEKKTELCTNLARLNTSIATLRSLSPSSTVGDFRNAANDVKTAYNNVKTSSAAVQEAKVEELDRAYADLDKAIESVPKDATLQQAAQSITPQVTAVQTARDQASTGLQCP